MKSKQDIQLELLAEIDDICSKNGLKYILIGQTALNAYLNHTVKNGTRMMSVAMTMGDMDRFCEIIENEYSDDRYVEGMLKVCSIILNLTLLSSIMEIKILLISIWFI